MNHREELAKLYPGLTEEDLVEAKENLERYLLLAWEIWESEPKAKEAALTPQEDGSTIKAKVESPQN